MDLFSEVYSCYFTAMRKVLVASQKSCLTNDDIAAIITSCAFSESPFFIMPHIQSGEWNLINKIDTDNLKTPVTALQKSWLKALLNDRRIRLFLEEEQMEQISVMLNEVSPLYENSDFHYFDAATDGDKYDDEQYIKNFRIILSAIKNKAQLQINYDSGKGTHSNHNYIPLKLNYSAKDDKFRLIACHLKPRKPDKAILNLSRIKSVVTLQNAPLQWHVSNRVNKSYVVLQIFQGRNALERYMLQFASMEKQTEYNEATDSYTCRIFYYSQDETELLIRILSFGPFVKVLEPDSFVAQIRERIKKQILLATSENPASSRFCGGGMAASSCSAAAKSCEMEVFGGCLLRNYV